MLSFNLCYIYKILKELGTLELGYIPPQYWIDLIIRPKYACRQCEDAVYQKPVPLSSNPKGLLAESLQAQIVVSKYTDHQPLHRQRRIMQRSGIELPVSTEVYRLYRTQDFK